MKKKIGFVGAGSIAKYHIEAARGAGFDLFGICAKPNSLRAKYLSSEYKFLNSVNDIMQLKDLELDAVAIIVETDESLNVYRELLDLKIPILIEKPVSVFAEDFTDGLQLDRESTLVGYNRRFYASVRILKQLTDAVGASQSHWNISELPSSALTTKIERIRMLKENSVHIFDLIRFLLGEIESMHVENQIDENGLKAASALCTSKTGSIATVSLSFGIPSNTSVNIQAASHNWRLQPIEFFQDFSAIKIIEPGSIFPFKQYQPTENSRWEIPRVDLDYKPGFLEQYKELYRMVQGEQRVVGASLKDAQMALKLANAFELGRYF